MTRVRQTAQSQSEVANGHVAVDTDDVMRQVGESIRRLRSYGWSEWQGQADAPGVNSRLDELQAAVLRDRLAQLPDRKSVV